jgi:hypothetical protein
VIRHITSLCRLLLLKNLLARRTPLLLLLPLLPLLLLPPLLLLLDIWTTGCCLDGLDGSQRGGVVGSQGHAWCGGYGRLALHRNPHSADGRLAQLPNSWLLCQGRHSTGHPECCPARRIIARRQRGVAGARGHTRQAGGA